MPPTKQTTIVGSLGKTREELSRTGDSWICLMPTNRRNSDKNIAAGQDEWIPDPTRPVKFLIVQSGNKTWLSALDLKCLLDLVSENKADIDASFSMVGTRAIEKADAMRKLFGDQ